MLNWKKINRSVKPFELIYDTHEIHFSLKVLIYEMFVQIFIPFTVFFSRNPSAQFFFVSIICNTNLPSLMNLYYIINICFRSIHYLD